MELSVVVPVHDEWDNLEPLVEELGEHLCGRGESFEVVLVDDGSTDGSSERIRELVRSRTWVRGLHLGRHCGQSAALDAGWREARGRVIVTLDADLQYFPADISTLLAALDGHDAAVGYRVRREDGWSRRASSRIANVVRRMVSGDTVADTGCSLKAMRRECVRSLKMYDGMHRFLPTLLRIDGFRVVEVPVRHRPRHSGRSKYGVRNRAVHAFVDLLAVRWMRRRRLTYEVTRDEP